MVRNDTLMKYICKLTTIAEKKISPAHPDGSALILDVFHDDDSYKITSIYPSQLGALKSHPANKTRWSSTYAMIWRYWQIGKFIRLVDDRELTYSIPNAAEEKEKKLIYNLLLDVKYVRYHGWCSQPTSGEQESLSNDADIVLWRVSNW